MATTQNKLIPVLGIVAVAIVGTIAWKNWSRPSKTQSGPAMTTVPQAELPPTKGADRDTPQETLQTVIASNRELRATTEQVIQENKALRLELEDERKRRPPPPQQQLMTIGPDGVTVPLGGDRAGGSGATRGAPSGAQPGAATPGSASASGDNGVVDLFSQAFDRASAAAGRVLDDQAGAFTPGGPRSPRQGHGPGPVGAIGSPGVPGTEGHGTQAAPDQARPGTAEGMVAYKVIPPMGYALQLSQPAGPNRVATGSYVRTTTPAASSLPASSGPATRAAGAAGAAGAAPNAKAEPVPYFTIPENATLAGVVSMTSLIGRVPIDGRVTDPMQFKAVIGPDNLAANGFELPDDLAGMIVSGIAIGDMALSCTEGKVRSITFVFNDGTINTVSARRGGGVGGPGATAARASTAFAGGTGGSGGDLGFISDLHGNPCIAGKFVTNAPAYLTDIVGMKTLEVAGQAYADAQRTVTSSGMFGTTNSTITGSVGSYALGQAVAGASDEVSKWLMARLKSSFDAVVTPSGQRMVVHLDTEIRIDKQPQGRRLVHRQQNAALRARGAHHGLE